MELINDIKAIEFYQSLSEDQKEKVNRKFNLKFPEDQLKDYPDHALHIIKCYMAMDMFGKRILKG